MRRNRNDGRADPETRRNLDALVETVRKMREWVRLSPAELLEKQAALRAQAPGPMISARLAAITRLLEKHASQEDRYLSVFIIRILQA